MSLHRLAWPKATERRPAHTCRPFTDLWFLDLLTKQTRAIRSSVPLRGTGTQRKLFTGMPPILSISGLRSWNKQTAAEKEMDKDSQSTDGRIVAIITRGFHKRDSLAGKSSSHPHLCTTLIKLTVQKTRQLHASDHPINACALQHNTQQPQAVQHTTTARPRPNNTLQPHAIDSTTHYNRTPRPHSTLQPRATDDIAQHTSNARALPHNTQQPHAPGRTTHYNRMPQDAQHTTTVRPRPHNTLQQHVPDSTTHHTR